MIATPHEHTDGTPYRATISCARCGKLVTDSIEEPIMCLTCKIMTAPPAEIAPNDLQVKRTIWPWLVGVALLAGAGIGAKAYLSHQKSQNEFEERHPVVATPVEERYLQKHAKDWKAGRAKLVASVAAIPEGEIKGAGACPLRVEIPEEANVAAADIASYRLRERVNPDLAVRPFLVTGTDLAQRVATHVDHLIAAGDRIRFQTGEGQYRVFAAIAIPLVIVRLTSETPAELVRATTGEDTFVPGRRTGTAYVFDRTSGALRCTGTFTATSSSEITAKGYLGNATSNADGTLARDLDEQTLRAIQTSLVSVGS